MMNKVEDIKKRIAEIQVDVDNLKKDLDTKKQSIYDLEEELNKELKRNYIFFCSQELNGNYFYYTIRNKEYIYDWYICVENVRSEHDEEDYIIDGRSILLVYNNNDGDRGEMVTVTVDTASKYMVTNGWGDSLAGYFEYDRLTKITEDVFKKNCNKINEINI